ncbi:MAG: hypothetical protein Q9181_004363 [Wetmoreana brouardii]
MPSSHSSDGSQSEDESGLTQRKHLTSTPRTPLSPQEPFTDNEVPKTRRSNSYVRFQGLNVTAQADDNSTYRGTPENPTIPPVATDEDDPLKIQSQSTPHLVDRIESLENPLRNLDLSRNPSSWEKGDESSERTGLSTEIQWMTWQEYLEDASKAKNILEVLFEKPHTNSRRMSSAALPTLENAPRLSTKLPASPYKSIERIRIRSSHIVNALQTITEQTFMSLSRPIIHRPFKVLLFYHDQIIDYLAELEHDFSESTRCALGEQCHGFLDLEGDLSLQNPRYTRSSTIRRGSIDGPTSPASALPVTACDNGCKHEVSEELLAQAEAITHLRILTKFMREDMKEIFARRKLLRSSKAERIIFQDLWHLFMAGDLLVADSEVSGEKGQALYQVSILPAADIFSSRRPVKEISTRTEGSHQLVESVYKEEAVSAMSVFTVDVFFFDFDGQKFGPVERRMRLVSFEGEKAIVDLPLYPLRFHKDADQLKETMLRRGMKFRELSATNEYPHREYNGLSVHEPQEQVKDLKRQPQSGHLESANSYAILRLTARSSLTLHWHIKNIRRMRQNLGSDLG